MDVHLLIYDLSGGMARSMSMGLLGFQLDAIYHTSIELQGREYVYDGGIVSIVPGSSHLGRPLERLYLGTTQLPMDVVEEYIESVRPIFTLEAYDLFKHNCNNFTDSFSNFLLGKGIPSHISSMPQAVLDSPMGRMLVPQLTQGVNGSRRQNGSILGLQQSGQSAAPSSQSHARKTGVHSVSSPAEFSRLLEAAKKTSAAVFFTSASCAPCKTVYPLFDQLAEELDGRVTLIKVDISLPQAGPIANQYSVRATPTFITFLHGEQENKWTGANPAALRGNLELLAQMADPSHLHARLNLPNFHSIATAKPVLYAKIPPLEKLLTKMGNDVAGKAEVQDLKAYITARGEQGAADAVLPSLAQTSSFVRDSIKTLPQEILFAIVDLFRCALVDVRFSAFFAEEADHETIRTVIGHVNENTGSCPYALRLVTLQMACNLFSTPLFPHEILKDPKLRSAVTQLISSSFLDESHNNVRVAASSLLFNLALADRKARKDRDGSATPGLPESDQVELAASVVEAIDQEGKSAEALQGMLLALGHLFYGADLSGELADLLRALDAQGTIVGKKKAFPEEKLIHEVGTELLGKGLRKP